MKKAEKESLFPQRADDSIQNSGEFTSGYRVIGVMIINNIPRFNQLINFPSGVSGRGSVGSSPPLSYINRYFHGGVLGAAVAGVFRQDN